MQKVKKLQVLSLSLLLMATIISSHLVPVVLGDEYRRSYDTIVSIGGHDWYYWNASSDKAAVVLFGGLAGTTMVWVNSLYSSEYTEPKIDFVEGLHANGYDILTNEDHGLGYSGSETWLYDVANWLSSSGYNYIYLFGFSAGGIVIAYEIQKDYASVYSAANVASAPVDWDDWSNHPIFQSAHTASEAKVRTSFIAPVEDWTYDQMLAYYNNVVIQKEWHNWVGGHDPFPNTCLDHPGETLLDAAYRWYRWGPPVQEHRYTVMEGVTTTCGDFLYDPWYWDEPFHTRPPALTPLLMNRNITFSDPDPEAGVVYLTVPAETYDGLSHIFFDATYGAYFRYQLFMEGEGYGWLFTGEGTNPISGDVDYYTFSNNTGTYWGPESPKTYQLAAVTGGFPSFGLDGIPGTCDDGFGDGTPDPNGSSILCLPTTLDVDYWDGDEWIDLYDAPWPQVWTTAVAYNIVDEPGSTINGVSSTMVGKPWEFLAGEDHPEYDPVPWSQPYSNAYVTYACTWSVLDHDPDPPGGLLLDIHFKIEERLVREDCVIADINGDEQVDIVDISICALAFGAKDEGFGYPVADPNFDARGDVSDVRGLIDIIDIVRININFGWKLTPNGIIKP